MGLFRPGRPVRCSSRQPVRSQSAGVVTVSAAISLTDALEAVAREFARTGGARCASTSPGRTRLSRQIVNGAPMDVFISADEAQMDVAVRRGSDRRKVRACRCSGIGWRSCRRPAARPSTHSCSSRPAHPSHRHRRPGSGACRRLRPRGTCSGSGCGTRSSEARAGGQRPGRSGAVENGSRRRAFTYETDAVTSNNVRGLRWSSRVMARRESSILRPSLPAAPNRRAQSVPDILRGPAASAIFRQLQIRAVRALTDGRLAHHLVHRRARPPRQR